MCCYKLGLPGNRPRGGPATGKFGLSVDLGLRFSALQSSDPKFLFREVLTRMTSLSPALSLVVVNLAPYEMKKITKRMRRSPKLALNEI